MIITGNTNGYEYRVRPVDPTEVQAIELRPLDKKELLAAGVAPGLDDVKLELRTCVEESNEAYVVEIQGRHEAYFGVAEDGVVWWLSSYAPFQIGSSVFQALTNLFLDLWQRQYDRIYNVTLTENITALEWLRSKGFTTEPDEGGWTYFYRR